MHNHGGFPLRGTSLALSLRVHERNTSALLLSLSKHHTRVPTSTGLIGESVQGDKSVPTLIITGPSILQVPDIMTVISLVIFMGIMNG